MITFKQKGDFSNTERFLKNAKDVNFRKMLEKYGREGVLSLSANTPKDTGFTADKWGYEIIIAKGRARIFWTNSNIIDGIPIVILLQYGHGTRSGTFIEGRDFINPVMRPIFDKIAEDVWKEVTSI